MDRFQKNRKGTKRKSVFHTQEQWQLHGNGYKRVAQLPTHIREKICTKPDVPELIGELDEHSSVMNCDTDSCLSVLKRLLGKLMNFEPRRTHEEGPQDEEQEQFAKLFFELGGVEILIRLLMFGYGLHYIERNKVVDDVLALVDCSSSRKRRNRGEDGSCGSKGKEGDDGCSQSKRKRGDDNSQSKRKRGDDNSQSKREGGTKRKRGDDNSQSKREGGSGYCNQSKHKRREDVSSQSKGKRSNYDNSQSKKKRSDDDGSQSKEKRSDDDGSQSKEKRGDDDGSQSKEKRGDDDGSQSKEKRGADVNCQSKRKRGGDDSCGSSPGVVSQGLEVKPRSTRTPEVCQSPPRSFPQGTLESERGLRVKSVILEVLTKLTTTRVGEQVAGKLLECDDILNYVFTLLAHKKTYISACQLIEDMLQSRKDVLDLHRIHNLRTLLCCLEDTQLANFCRILAVAISDLDIYENKSSLFAQNKQKRSKGFVNLRDINQELLLGIPELLPRLVRIAICKEYTPRFRGMVSELDCWMEWIDNQMADEVFDQQDRDDLEDFIGGISEPCAEGGALVQQQGLKITEELVHRVEVVYVLGLFLLGKHRKKVQRKLADLKLAPGLSELFDQFIWKYQLVRHHSRHRLRGHNASCECSPEVALKIQFLRLVHSFCDHSDYKHLLLSKNELNEVRKINVHAGQLALQNLDSINKQLMCRGSKGLLSKIVEVMKKEPPTSTFRFWLARAVESYLRGDTSYCDQIFLMRRGLLHHVASNIVEHEIRHKEILQSSFDLLGELVKFNWEAFRMLDNVLNPPPGGKDSTSERSGGSSRSSSSSSSSSVSGFTKFEKFTSTVNRNMVDSNMFIRSLVLSLEHFRAEGREVDKKESRLIAYISDFNRQLDYLYKLITNISVQNLTQENVSCLNTTLVFLMFANKKDQLPRYLQALRDEKENMADVTGSGSILQNFRDLLVFWQDHYLHKDKDCSALEKSSRISFSYWKKTVAMLVSDDNSDHNAVAFYINPLPAARTN